MTDTFGLEIYASNKLVYAGRAKKLVIPAVDGEQAFLAHHENIVAAIIPGEMRFESEDGTRNILAVSNGFVEMINNRAKLFCLTVERPEEIDIRRAQEAKERAEEQLRQKQSIQEYHMNQTALARAMTRLRVTRKQDI
ncbi:MAG: ATP synthase F1 subunit epsilon [Eubacteriales bacterium]|nr:ATP synthase F1 subunit epsilon [Eubacteriales bacterium]